MTIFQQAFSDAKRSAASALKFALAIIAAALAMASAACEDARTPPTPAPIAAVPTGALAPSPTTVPTIAPAPSPTAVPTIAPATTPTAVPTNAPAPSLTAAEAQRIYDDAVDAVSALSSYRVQASEILDLGNGGKSKFSLDFQFQAPGMSKSKFVLGLGTQTPVETENVDIGGYSYMKTSGNPFYDDPNAGKWIREEAAGMPSDEYAAALLSGFRVDAAAGTERLDGVETRRLTGSAYSGDLNFGMIMATSSDSFLEVDVWIGVADGLIRRIAAATEPGAAESVEITVVFSEFDVPVVVEAPKDYIEEADREAIGPPPDTAVETTVLSSGWTRAYLPDYGFSVSAPPDWSVFGSAGAAYYEMNDYLANLSPEAASAASALSLATIHYFVPHRMTGFGTAAEGGETRVSALIVNIMGVWADAELSEYVDERMAQTEASLVIDGAIQRRAETLPAGEAERVEFAFRFPYDIYGVELDADADYAQIQYFILAQGDAFILTFATTADRIDAMRPAFADIARTARIEPRP